MSFGARASSYAPAVTGVTITDDFNRANGSLGADWTVISGALSISSNRAANGSNLNSAGRHNTPLNTDDHYSQIDVTTTGPSSLSEAGVLVRMHASEITYYMGRYQSSTGNWEIYKRVTSTFTLLASASAGGHPSVPYTLRLEAEGSSQRLYAGGVLKLSHTDASITGNVRAGFRLNSSQTVDNFAAGDL